MNATTVNATDVNATNVSTTDLTATGNTTVNNFTVQNGATVDMGNNIVTNVANGTNATDAVNKGQLDEVAGTANTAIQTFTTSVNGTEVETITKDNNDVGFVNGTGTTARDVKGNITFDINKANLSTDATGTVNSDKAGDNFATAENVADIINKTATNLTTKGFGLKAEDGSAVTQTLGNTIEVVGDENINTVVKDGKVEVQLSKDLNVTTVNATTVKTGDTTMTDNGLTITGGPSLTKSGIDAADKKITNVANGTVGAGSTDAVNGGQLQDVISKGFKINADSGAEDTVALNESVTFTGKSGNIVTTVVDNAIEFALANSITVGAAHPITINGTAGTITGLTNKTFDPNNIVTGQAATEDQLKMVSTTANSALQDFTTSVNGQVVETLNKDNKDVNFVNGTGTTAKASGKDITFDVNKSTLTADADGKVTADKVGDNFATAENVADIINKTATNLTTKGFGLKAEDGKTVNQSLGNTIEVVGDENINTVVKDGKVEVQLSKDLNVNSVNATTVTTGDTTMTDNGITIANGAAGKQVSLTKDGLNNGGNKITNVADGTDPTDAVNKRQLDAVATTANNAIQTFTTSVNGQKVETITKDNNDVSFVNGSGTTARISGTDITFDVNKSSLTTDAAGNVTADKAGDNFATAEDVAKAINTAGKASKTEVKEGDNIKVTSSTGANGQTIYTIATAKDLKVDSITAGNTVVNNDGLTIANGPAITQDGINANNTKVSGVANGDISPTSTDAVNGSQLYKVEQLITGIPDGKTTVIRDGKEYTLTTYNVKGQTEYVTNSVVTAIHNMNEQGIKFFHTNDGVATPINQSQNGVDSSASGAYATAVGYKANAGKTNALAIGNSATATGENAIAIGANAQATAENSISVGHGNIVDGKSSGAFGDPNYVMGTDVNNVAVEGSYAVGNDNVINSSDTFVLGNNVNNTGTLDSNGKPKAVSNTVENSVYLGNKTTATAGDGSKTGSLRNKKHDGTNGETTTAGSTGTVSEATVGGITYGGFAGAKANGVVSVGAAGSERRIQNVAAGEISSTSTDAINGSQLYSAMNKFGTNINNIHQRMGKIDRDLRSGIAGAVAIGSLVQAYNPSDSLLAVGGGTYRGSSALALGYSKVSDNGKIILKVTGSVNNSGHYMGGASVGYRF